MSVREYAIRNGKTIGTIYRQVWEGRIGAEKIDGRWLILPAEKEAESEERD